MRTAAADTTLARPGVKLLRVERAASPPPSDLGQGSVLHPGIEQLGTGPSCQER